MIVNIYTEVSSKAPKVTKKWFGYVLECEVNGVAKTKEGFGSVDGSYHKTELTALAEALARVKPGNEVVIHSDNNFILNSIEKNLENWAWNDFSKAAGKPVANAEEWQKIWHSLKDTEHHVIIGNHQYTNWLIAQISVQSMKN